MCDRDLTNLCNQSKSLVNLKPLIEYNNYQELVFFLQESWDEFLSNESICSVMEKVNAVLNRSWEILNTGIWSDVPFEIRHIYSVASLIKVCCLLKEDNLNVEKLKKTLSVVDDGLLLGAGLGNELTHLASTLTSAIYKGEDSFLKGGIPCFTLDYKEVPGDWDTFGGIKGNPVLQLHSPSLETFSNQYFFKHVPLKLTGCVSHWPALEKWKDIEYLVKVSGPRKVPIEVGSKYTESDWGMKMIPLREFILDHILSKSETVGYLAQHQLFNQIAELKEDISIPEYCYLTESDDKNSSIDVNAWFGPKGTLSPLHYDPKHNLLTQVIGRKRILLYSPADSCCVYPFEGRILHNTAQVDPEKPDYDKFPQLSKVTPYECHLYPGEILYIPPKWWHHVRALDISFSVSFWWQ